MTMRRYLLAIPVGIIIAACGGSSADVGDVPDSGGDDGANSDGSTADSGGNPDAVSMGDVSTGAETGSETGATDSGLNDSALTIDGNDGGGCPNVFGSYTMLAATGTGCGPDFNTAAKQCIVHFASVGVSNLCDIRFNSEQPATIPFLNGPSNVASIDLKTDGTFDNADLRFGSTTVRNNCTGAWNAATETMTVTCSTGGGCVATMVRTAATCP